jgi:serine/threonine protein kinase/WD40 repeat protein
LLLALECVDGHATQHGPESIDPGEAPTIDFPGGEVATDDDTLGYTPGATSDEQPTLDSPSDLDVAAEPGETLAPGQILGDRYRVRSCLGKGGMGEVWRAFDLKLRVDVALKSLRSELTADERALEALRSEVRLAREVVSPNACRVYDLEELKGQELVSMEYIDGTTLLDVIQNRGPLELSEAREIASQFLAGLAAVHEAGLVHRDMKPENVMLTRAGRVVVMDFGIAKSVAEGQGGLIAGTPAYMPPEQSKGEELDARADVFAAGVVLAEMTAPSGVRKFDQRRTIWEGIHQEQPTVPETPWSKILTQAVSPRREDRYPGASALARALEEIALRVEGAEELHPYPGLSAFTSDNARYFFGRELEIESMWKKLRRPHLLGLIGPSGAGKSSFVRAGLLPVMPEGWRAIVTAPGNRPFQSLAQGLAAELEDDSAVLKQLLEIEDPTVAVEVASAWRGQNEQGLLVLDQFEELFTQNPPDVQQKFSELLACLALDADIHVLLSMRDDFLFHCSDQPALAPVFSELTPLSAPTGAALRRAVVQPALKCGYRFGDEALVEEILADVEGERGALPMLAFACSRLWEKRDREEGLLTRQAYEAIGGVAGSLAHHAEATLERVGNDQVPVVRELFRNLVTAQGTRASRDRHELLSVFAQISAGHRAEAFRSAAHESPAPQGRPESDAGAVLDTLIDARLLTSYDVPAADGEEGGQTRVEIVHESLLSNWPRLMRWRMQDAEGAQLRDELRQAAELWEKRGNPEDLLWTGTSFKEYELWRERYGGGLTAKEEAFAVAMKSRAERRRKQRRIALGAAFAVLGVVVTVFAGLWRQSEEARKQAVRAEQEAQEQAARAEANQLLALGRLEIDRDPTTALAYAIASLERADDFVTRQFALEVLSGGPTWFLADSGGGVSVDFSPDGRWLAGGVGNEGSLKLWPRRGGEPRVLGTHDGPVRRTEFNADSDVVSSFDWMRDVARIWSVDDGEIVREIAPGRPMDIYLHRSLDRLLTFTQHDSLTRIQGWPLNGEEFDLQSDIGMNLDAWYNQNQSWGLDIDPTGTRLAYVPLNPLAGARADGMGVFVVSLGELGTASPRLIGRHSDLVNRIAFHPDGVLLAAGDTAGEVRIWDIGASDGKPIRVLGPNPGRVQALGFSDDGSKLAAASNDAFVALWDLEGPPDAEPVILPLGDTGWAKHITFDPSGDWLATASMSAVRVWPVLRRYPLALEGHEEQVHDLVFLPDGDSLASVGQDGTLRLWPLSATGYRKGTTLFKVEQEALFRVAVDPSGAHLLTGGYTGRVWLVPLNGEQPRTLEGIRSHIAATALGPNGRFAAASGRSPDSPGAVICVWNLDTGATQTLAKGDAIASELRFTPEGRLISGSDTGVRIWNLADGSFEALSEKGGQLDLTPDGRFLLVGQQGENYEAVLHDLEKDSSRQLDSRGPAVWVALGAEGRVAVTVGEQVQVGPVTGEAHHLILGVRDLGRPAVSPDGRWIAALDQSHMVRLWPMPDLSQPPLHTLPTDELVAKLKTLTNLRVVRDENSATDWSLDLDPFPGWAEVPTW